MAKYYPDLQMEETKAKISPALQRRAVVGEDLSRTTMTVYAESPAEVNFQTLQKNLKKCLNIVDNEVMKNYIPSLQHCEIVPLSDAAIGNLKQIQFFRITELVYEENEFSVHKIATIFNALSNKPCTLVLMIQSDGQENEFYLGVRSRDDQYSTGTMRQMLERSLLGLFPGSATSVYLNEKLKADLSELNIGCVSSVTCIADYKQDKDSVENKDFIQGLEKLVSSMKGKPFTAICIANNLGHQDLIETRKEYEEIYTLLSPFANMQYNYALSNSDSTSESNTQGNSETDTTGRSVGISKNQNESSAHTTGTNITRGQADMVGNSSTVGVGESHTVGTSDGINDSESITNTTGSYKGMNVGVSEVVSIGGTVGVSQSVSRGSTHGTSHTDSMSDTISRNLSYGLSRSKSFNSSSGKSENSTIGESHGSGRQYTETESTSLSTNYAYTKALTNTFGSSQAVTLNIQNKSLIDTLQRLEKQLERLDECESIGMWDFAAYFLGESAAEAETAANMYRSIVSGSHSGLEIPSVNTWTDWNSVKKISKYITNFSHPAFLYQFEEDSLSRQTIVDATALISTNELAIQIGFPRKSVKGLPVIEHAVFAQEVLKDNNGDHYKTLKLGKINYLGAETETPVDIDIQSLSMHTFITGSTGSGKSNTVYQILSELGRKNVKFLVVEPAKGEYKNMFGQQPDVHVYGTNPMCTPLLRINPFKFPKGVHVLEHIDRLVEIFNVCWPMYAAMPAVLKSAVLQAYEVCGWDLIESVNTISPELFPTFQDLLAELTDVIDNSSYDSEVKSNYKGSLETRVKSLADGLNGQIFSADEIDNHELFDSNVIVDLSRIGSMETKSLIMGLMVMRLSEYRMTHSDGMNVPLKHVTVLEEAHNILKRTSTEQSMEGANVTGKSVEMISNAIAEMRTYGEGFIIADQSPSAVDVSAIRNTNTKIIMRLPDEIDRRAAGKSAGLRDDQLDEIAKLQKGVAVVYQNDWVEPVLCKIKKYPGEEKMYTYAVDQRHVKTGNDDWFKKELLKLLMKGRVNEAIEVDIKELREEVPTAELSTKDKIGVYQLLDEYEKTEKLTIWEDVNFRALSSLVVGLFGCGSRVENLIAKAKNFEDLNQKFVDLIHRKFREASDEMCLSLSQCFMKDYSVKEEKNLEIYSAWREIVMKRGGII